MEKAVCGENQRKPDGNRWIKAPLLAVFSPLADSRLTLLPPGGPLGLSNKKIQG